MRREARAQKVHDDRVKVINEMWPLFTEWTMDFDIPCAAKTCKEGMHINIFDLLVVFDIHARSSVPVLMYVQGLVSENLGYLSIHLCLFHF